MHRCQIHCFPTDKQKKKQNKISSHIHWSHWVSICRIQNQWHGDNKTVVLLPLSRYSLFVWISIVVIRKIPSAMNGALDTNTKKNSMETMQNARIHWSSTGNNSKSILYMKQSGFDCFLLHLSVRRVCARGYFNFRPSQNNGFRTHI